MIANSFKYTLAITLMCLAPILAFGQTDALVLASGTVSPGGTVALNLNLTSASGHEPAALQWTLTYSATDIVNIYANPGTAATSANKALSCNAKPGSYTCLLTGLTTSGLNANPILNGAVAVVTVMMSPSVGSTSIGVTNALGAAPSGGALSITTTGGSITTVLPVSLTFLACNPTSIPSGGTSTCTVTLNQPAPAGGTAVALSDNSLFLSVPASVTVPAGAASASFAASAGTITSSQSATVTATLNGSSQAATISLVAPVLVTALTCNPTSVNSGASTTCAVTLNQVAPAGGSIAALSDNSTSLTVPASVTVAAGSTSAAFAATAGTLTTTQAATVTASLGGASQTASLTLVAPMLVTALACNPTSVNSGASATCTITLNQVAPAGGSVITISDNNTALSVPASVAVTAGATSATFTASAGTLTTNQSATITVTLGGASQSATLALIAPVLISGFSCDAATLDAGGSSNCTVTLSAPAPTGGVTVSASADTSALTVPATVSILAGASTAVFTATATTEPPDGGATLTPSITATLNAVSRIQSFTLILCPCSLWPSTGQPVNPASTNKQAIEVGMQFTSNVSGFVTGVRFYKGTTNKGTHVGSLWAADGTHLGWVTFTNETKSGWQAAYFPSPVAITANTTYVISYHAPQGHNAADDGSFTSPVSQLPLQALLDGQNGPNGLYKYGAAGFPNTGAAATNYWVDPIFNTSATVGTAVPVSFWMPTAVPKTPAVTSAKAAELGLRFLSSVPGYITGLRFYKSATNLGQHVGYLWTTTGTQLATVTFTNESASGWQQANFASPVAIDPNTAYVISYWSPKGHYAADAGYFATLGLTNQMMYAPPDGQYGPNGAYTATKVFPASSSSSSNYWVDMVFTTAIQ